MSKGAADTQTQSTTVTGGNSNFVTASGSLGSSSLSAFAGPWYIETQSLEVNYVRVPMEQSWNNTCNATLSGLTTTHGNIQATRLLYNYTANYNTTIAYQNFNSSSVQQPQEFAIIAASGDPNGVVYGSLNASTLGPMGSIITTKPFIRRTPYTSATSSTQPLVSKIAQGSNFAVFTFDSSAGYDIKDSSMYETDLNFWSQTGDPIGNASMRTEFFTGDYFYQIPGAYATNKELFPLDTLLDNIAHYITNEFSYAYPVANAHPVNGQAIRDTGIPEYDKNRHA